MEQNGSPLTPRTLSRPGSAVRVSRTPGVVGETISLTQPRPSTTRARNEYIETPLKGGVPQPTSHATPLHQSTHIYLSGPKRSDATRRSLPVTKQPVAAAFSKPTPDCASVVSRDSIVCPQCDKCRCEACRTPRPLPQKWLCGDKCLCSATAAVDYLSCLCCVKGLLYHCVADEDSAACADRPCSCAPQHRVARWTCLASLSVVLPCLCCYWPLKACVKAVELCHQRCRQRGCRCRPQTPATSSVVASKRLLDTRE